MQMKTLALLVGTVSVAATTTYVVQKKMHPMYVVKRGCFQHVVHTYEKNAYEEARRKFAHADMEGVERYLRSKIVTSRVSLREPFDIVDVKRELHTDAQKGDEVELISPNPKAIEENDMVIWIRKTGKKCQLP